MRVIRATVEGYRTLKSFTWRPGDLEVLTGAGSDTLFGALRLFASAARGWSGLSDAMNDERAREPGPWSSDVNDLRLFALTAPAPDGELCFGHEMSIERLEGAPWWCVGYERTTLSDDFDVVDIVERIGARAEYQPPRKKVPGTPVTMPSKAEVTRLNDEMSVFAGVRSFRADKRVAPHAEAIASWSLLRHLAVGEGSPLRTPVAPSGFSGRLDEDGANLIALVANVCDWYDTRRRFNAAMREVFLGFEAMYFEKRDHGVAMALGTRDGRVTPCVTLSSEALLTLTRLSVLCSPEPPPLLWIDRPDEGVLPWALPTLATCCVEAARYTQVVLSHPSPRFEALLRTMARSPGSTVRRSPLRVNFTEC